MKPSEVAAQISQREQDERWMRHAMALAARAEGIGEIPVGAVLRSEEHTSELQSQR